MKKTFFIISIINAIIIAMIIATTSFAADNTKVQDIKAQELDARYSYIECRAILVESQATLLADYGTISGIDTIKSDLTQLKSVAQTGDAQGFNALVQTISSEFKTTNNELKDARQAFSKANISDADRNTLKASWNSTLSDFNTCNINARKSIVSIREEILQADIDRWNSIIANMTAKGMDTTDLQQVVTDAQKLLSQLNAASSATDDTTFKSLINDANNERLHVWARFAIGRLKANIGQIQSIAARVNHTENIEGINSLLNSASGLAAIGKKYGPGEFQQTWQDIKNADAQSKTLASDLREYAKNMRQEIASARQNYPRNFTPRNPEMNRNISDRIRQIRQGQRVPPSYAGQNNTANTGESNPEDTGESNPEDTGESNPEDTVQNSTGDQQ